MKAFVGRLWPDTLVGRTVLVLLCGLLLSQLAGVLIYSANRLELANRLDARHTAERIAGVVRLVEETSEPERGRAVNAMDVPGLRIGWGERPLISDDDGDDIADSDNDVGNLMIRDDLVRRLPSHEIRSVIRDRPPVMPSDRPDPGPGMRHSHPPTALVSVHLSDGSWLNFAAPLSPPNEPLWRPRFFAPLGSGLLVVIVLSVFAVRRAAKPLALLAAAAQRLGRDVTAPPVPVSGPREVRAAAQAFNEMQTRLRRFVEDRTELIAAISHDLRTPITRMKLRAEFVEDEEERSKMLADLDDMEEMICATLSFARDDVARETRGPVDLAAVLKDLCDVFDATYQGPDSLTVTGGAAGLKSAFANLLENANKYANGARVTLAAGDGQVTVVAEDDGPGIPQEELDRVFTPFYRLETSRNRDTGGVGLGLAVARSAIRKHGGDICLTNRTGGGLRAVVTLPA
jgi:signal transduction histidine kinase